MIWIHGGAFTTGSNSTPSYRADSVVEDYDVCVVTINYRLARCFRLLRFRRTEGIGQSKWNRLRQLCRSPAPFGVPGPNFRRGMGGPKHRGIWRRPRKSLYMEKVQVQSPPISSAYTSPTSPFAASSCNPAPHSPVQFSASLGSPIALTPQNRLQIAVPR
ncbi:hypothetical protein M427DRAFT_327714 [Gonapodya prolifera JEL478]|uniref:Carboxylesterase type B domain-containing protein n=1 Tax=Gonapodya prolifera (strain JEL478) TaxID=1344416 RepID=A0A139AFX4_GONPJ|nr:hypothetical protein M427DRAFT_327714 [Gonapodya prolifera JEL478]|eukprot:KXS15325.1 hypothetical protein M427DRAFT_327714 [Gonapodya prolifera JEL478]